MSSNELLEEVREIAHRSLGVGYTVPDTIEHLNREFDECLFSMANDGSIMMQDTRNDYVKPVRVV